jgi:hypothetical protein
LGSTLGNVNYVLHFPHLSLQSPIHSNLNIPFLPNILSNLDRQLPTQQIWVSNSGNDTHGDGSENNPYQTPSKAFQAHPDNIQLMLFDGVYNVTVPPGATNLAVIGSPSARLNWLIWEQTGGTSPLSIYALNLVISHYNATLMPMLRLSGEIMNATLRNVEVQASLFHLVNPTVPAVTIVTGPLSGSSITLDRVKINNNGTALANVEFLNFDKMISTGLDLRGHLGSILVSNIKTVNIFHGMWIFGAGAPTSHTGMVTIQKSHVVLLKNVFGFGTSLSFLNNAVATLTDSSMILSTLQSGSIANEPCLLGMTNTDFNSNSFQDSEFIYTLTSSSGTQCLSTQYQTSFKGNAFFLAFEVTTSPATIIDFQGNYWNSQSGPSICSNPGGTGSTVSYNMDYSAWCEDQSCQHINNYPLLLPEVIKGPCQRPTASSIVAFIFIFFFLVAINVVMLIIYCMYCQPRRTDNESIHVHYSRMTAVMSSVAAVTLIILAVSGAIGSGVCPTRVYATKCPFTLTDRAVAGNGLLFGSLMGMVATGAVFLLKFNLQEQRPILYTSMGFQLLSIGLSWAVLVISLLNLSSSLRGPYMHLLSVPAAGYIVFGVLHLFHMEKLIKYCRHTHIAMELTDYKHERASLLATDKSALVADDIDDALSKKPVEDPSVLESDSEGTDSQVIDEYTVPTIKPIQVFYSNYQQVTQRWLIAEITLFAVLFAFALWYTLASYKVPGAIMLTLIILEYLRIILAIIVTRGRGPLYGFKAIMTFTAFTKLALLAISIFLYVQVFLLTNHNSAYFTASLLAPTFFLGIITTIRIWKMFEVVHEKNSRLHL